MGRKGKDLVGQADGGKRKEEKEEGVKGWGGDMIYMMKRFNGFCAIAST